MISIKRPPFFASGKPPDPPPPLLPEEFAARPPVHQIKFSCLSYAHQLFDGMPHRPLTSYNYMIAGYSSTSGNEWPSSRGIWMKVHAQITKSLLDGIDVLHTVLVDVFVRILSEKIVQSKKVEAAQKSFAVPLATVGSFTGKSMPDKCGRTKTFILGAIPLTVGTLHCATAQNLETRIGQLLDGIRIDKEGFLPPSYLLKGSLGTKESLRLWAARHRANPNEDFVKLHGALFAASARPLHRMLYQKLTAETFDDRKLYSGGAQCYS